MSKDLTRENIALLAKTNKTNNSYGMSGGGCRLLLLFLLYILYLLMGAAVFTAIESPIEKDMLDDIVRARSEFLKKYPKIEEDDLDSLLMAVVTSSRRGVHLPPPNQKPVMNWSFGQALFFSSTIITTIGYGEQSPLSERGKLFCIFYTLLGIPLTLLLLSTMVQRLLNPINGLLMWMNSKLGHLYQPLYIRLLHLTLVMIGILLLCLILPAALLDQLESEWNFLDSFYYCFISLTTVGLGDFIPGDSPRQEYRAVYKTFVAGYLIVGLLCMMLLMTIFTSIPELDITTWFLPSFSSQEDPERQRLHNAGSGGPLYSQQLDDRQNETFRVVRARSRRDDEAEWEDSSNKSQHGDISPASRPR